MDVEKNAGLAQMSVPNLYFTRLDPTLHHGISSLQENLELRTPSSNDFFYVDVIASFESRLSSLSMDVHDSSRSYTSSAVFTPGEYVVRSLYRR